MDFRQHYLPGKPLEHNGQTSAGLQLDLESAGGWQWGADAELFRGDLEQFQDRPADDAAPPVAAIRPVGRHYDYVVDGRRAGGHVARRLEWTEGWSLDRKSIRLNSSHVAISYAVFCLKKKKESY